MNILEGIFKSTWLQFTLNFIVLVISVILLKIVINRFSANLVKRQPEQKGQIDLGKRILNSIVYLLAAYVLIQEIPVLSKMATSLLAGSSIVALVIGFASQEVLTNVVSGAFIIFFKPFVIGDRILLPEKNLTGFVEDISLRHTVLRTIQNTRVIVPNATVNKAILENYDYKDKRRLNFFRIGVAYETDLNRAMAIIEEEIVKHPNFLDSRSEQEKAEGVKACVVRVAELANSAIFLSAGAWSKDYGSGFVMMTELNKIIKERFDQEKIKITYPYQKIELSQ